MRLILNYRLNVREMQLGKVDGILLRIKSISNLWWEREIDMS